MTLESRAAVAAACLCFAATVAAAKPARHAKAAARPPAAAVAPAIAVEVEPGGLVRVTADAPAGAEVSAVVQNLYMAAAPKCPAGQGPDGGDLTVVMRDETGSFRAARGFICRPFPPPMLMPPHVALTPDPGQTHTIARQTDGTTRIHTVIPREIDFQRAETLADDVVWEACERGAAQRLERQAHLSVDRIDGKPIQVLIFDAVVRCVRG